MTLPEQRTPELRGITLFEGLPDDDLEKVGRLAQEITVPAGTSLVNVPLPGEAVYLILDGSASVQIQKSDGGRTTLLILGPGDCILEVGHIHPHIASTTVITRQETRLLWIEGRAFVKFLEMYPALGRNITRELSHQLRRAYAQLSALASLDATGRIAYQILELAEHWGTFVPGQGIQIPVSVTEGEIAEMTAASRDRVHLVLSRLERAGILTMDTEDRMTVHRPEILPKLSQA